MRVRRPNVIVVLADDMGYGDFGVFGDGSPRTPVLDGLVAEGVTLTQHYAGSCVCAPSRAALLTGRYAHRTGAVDTLEARGLDRLALREVTLADHFRRAGGVTGLIGKWHLGAIDPRYHPTARGFDEFIGFRGGWSDYYDWQLDWAGAVRRGDGRYLTDVLSDVAVDFIERHRERPFLLHLCFNAPHFPFQAPAEELLPFTASGRHSLGVSTIHAMIARMDRGLGRVLHALDRCGLREDTIVLFTSDNGPQLGGEGEWSTRRHNAGWNGAKGTVYEGGIRVPAVIRWPGGLPAGTRPAGLVHFVDWLPTLAELARRRRDPRRSAPGRPERRPDPARRAGGCRPRPLLAMEPLHAPGRVQRRGARRPLEAPAAGHPGGHAPCPGGRGDGPGDQGRPRDLRRHLPRPRAAARGSCAAAAAALRSLGRSVGAAGPGRGAARAERPPAGDPGGLVRRGRSRAAHDRGLTAAGRRVARSGPHGAAGRRAGVRRRGDHLCCAWGDENADPGRPARATLERIDAGPRT